MEPCVKCHELKPVSDIWDNITGRIEYICDDCLAGYEVENDE